LTKVLICNTLESEVSGGYVDSGDDDAVEEGEEGDCVVDGRDCAKGQDGEQNVCKGDTSVR
jgi:hypothetical protein